MAKKQRKTTQKKEIGGITGKGFKPGQSGNPKGRPRGRTLLTLVREMLQQNEGKPLEVVAQAYINAMGKGSFQHLKEYIDREEGKVPDRVANADGSNLAGAPDLAKLTTEELTLYRALLIKAKSQDDVSGQ